MKPSLLQVPLLRDGTANCAAERFSNDVPEVGGARLAGLATGLAEVLLLVESECCRAGAQLRDLSVDLRRVMLPSGRELPEWPVPVLLTIVVVQASHALLAKTSAAAVEARFTTGTTPRRDR